MSNTSISVRNPLSSGFVITPYFRLNKYNYVVEVYKPNIISYAPHVLLITQLANFSLFISFNFDHLITPSNANDSVCIPIVYMYNFLLLNRVYKTSHKFAT